MKTTLKRLQIRNILIKFGAIHSDELVEELYITSYGGIAKTSREYMRRKAIKNKKK